MEELIEKISEEFEIDKSKWVLTKFGNVAIQQKYNVDRENTDLTRYVKGEHMGSEDLHLRSWGELKDEYLGPAFIRRFDEGDILYGSRRTYLRKVVLAPFSGITSNTTFVIKPNIDVIDKRLLPFIMMSEGFTDNSIRNSKGSVNPYINWKDIAKYEFLLPPKDQQAQLAKLLWAMDAVIERDSELRLKLTTCKQSWFKYIVNTEEGRMVPLSEVLKLQKSKSKPPHEIERYIGLENIESGSNTCESYSDSKEVLSQCNIVKPGNLCYSKLRPYLDKAFIADFDAVSTTELLVYEAKGINNKYVLEHLHSPRFLNFIAQKGFGTKMPRVSDKLIGAFKIKKIHKEENLLEGLSRFEKADQELKIKIRDSKSLQKSLINQIF